MWVSVIVLCRAGASGFSASVRSRTGASGFSVRVKPDAGPSHPRPPMQSLRLAQALCLLFVWLVRRDSRRGSLHFALRSLVVAPVQIRGSCGRGLSRAAVSALVVISHHAFTTRLAQNCAPLTEVMLTRQYGGMWNGWCLRDSSGV